MAKSQPQPTNLREHDRVELLNPNTGEPYGEGNIAQVHTIDNRINSVRVHRDTGIDTVVRPTEIRKK